jgi:3-oxoacyl-[acyl-carrier protein] reductase
VVTGAAGGIGRAVLTALEASGCRVAACDLAEFDVRDRRAVNAGMADAISGLGGCDALVAGAGIVDTIHRAERFSEEDWRQDLEANLYGAFFVVQSAFEALAESGDGRVVLISSAAAEIGIPGQVAYGAAKAGLIGMARTLAAEWAPHGIRCNVVMPGFIATPKVTAMPARVQEAVTEAIPLRRFGATDELAGTISFLLSPAAAYMTGAVVRVDGGLGLSASGLV